jgi:DNA-binding LacI/PurR family transcriptional regulator
MAKQPASARPTSFDVARRAGVSRGAVSQILNGRTSRYPEETQQRVRAAAAELDYRPSPAGVALVTGRSNVVFCVMPNSTFGPAMQDVNDQLVEVCSAFGMSLVLSIASNNPAITLEHLRQFRPAAVVDFSAALSERERAELQEAGSQVFPADVAEYGPRGRLSIESGRTLARTLLARNDGRPLVYCALDDKRPDHFGPARYEGMSLEARAHGVAEPVRLEVPLEIEGAKRAVRAAYDDLGPFSAGCYNDDVAMAVLAAAQQLELTVPDQLTIVGMDRTELGQLTRPRLTTVQLRFDVLIDLVVAEMRAAWQGAQPPPTLSPEQIIRVVPGETA